MSPKAAAGSPQRDVPSITGAVTPPAAHRRSPMQIQRSLQEAGMRARERERATPSERETRTDGMHVWGPEVLTPNTELHSELPKMRESRTGRMEFRMKNRPRQTHTQRTNTT